MKRNLNQPINDMNGIPITEPHAEGARTVTVKKIAVDALLANYEDERNLSGEDKVKRFRLAQKIHVAEDEIEITAEEISLIKRLVGKGYAPLAVGQVFDLLEGAAP